MPYELPSFNPESVQRLSRESLPLSRTRFSSFTTTTTTTTASIINPPRQDRTDKMIVIPLKACSPFDLKRALIEWLDGLSAAGGLANPLEYVSLRPKFRSAECYKEIQRLASLRNCLVDAITKPHAHKYAVDEFALQDCHEYHAALLAFEQQGFPTRDEHSRMQLEYRSAFGTEKESHGSLTWERACTIWNIAALESFMASIQVKDKEGRKVAVKHLQNAAAAMVALQDLVKGQTFEGVDLSQASLRFWEKAMLAEAQTAAYEMTANTAQQSLQSYLAIGAVELWNESLQLAKDPMLVSAWHKSIVDIATECKGCSMLLTARAEYHQALASRQEKDWGVEIARLTKASAAIQETLDFYKKSKLESDQVVALQRFIDSRKTQVIRDNRMYGEHVPDTVPEIRSHILVKSSAPLPESMTKPKMPLFGKN